MTMSQDMELPISVVASRRIIDASDRASAPLHEGYSGYGTGEVAPLASVYQKPNVAKNPRRPGQSEVAAAGPPRDRGAFRKLGAAAIRFAREMMHFAESKEGINISLSAQGLSHTLESMWELRAHRDLEWQTIVNHAQGMVSVLFRQGRTETLTPEQCKPILDIALNHLGPSTKTARDVNEVLRLIEDVGVDPYAAISSPDDCEAT